MNSSDFTRDGFTLLDGLIDLEQVVDLKDHIFGACLKTGEIKSDSQVPRAPSKYGDPVTERLLEQLIPTLEPAAHCSLLPTYSYWRVYRKGDCLPKHRDRAACEISLTLTIDYDGEEPWPIMVANGQGEWPIEVPRGSGLLYKGTEIYHWREAFKNAWAVQVFLHYVDRDGPFKQHRFDGREALGLPPVVRQAQVQDPGTPPA